MLGVFVGIEVDVLLEEIDDVCVAVCRIVPVLTGLVDTVFVGCELRDPEALAVGVLLDFVVTGVVPEAVVVFEAVSVPVGVTVAWIVLLI